MRRCKHCRGEIPAERNADAEYCDDRCKRKAFERRRNRRCRVAAAKKFWTGYDGVQRRRPAIRSGTATAIADATN